MARYPNFADTVQYLIPKIQSAIAERQKINHHFNSKTNSKLQQDSKDQYTKLLYQFLFDNILFFYSIKPEYDQLVAEQSKINVPIEIRTELNEKILNTRALLIVNSVLCINNKGYLKKI